jgi:hypothetical protein
VFDVVGIGSVFVTLPFMRKLVGITDASNGGVTDPGEPVKGGRGTRV